MDLGTNPNHYSASFTFNCQFVKVPALPLAPVSSKMVVKIRRKTCNIASTVLGTQFILNKWEILL